MKNYSNTQGSTRGFMYELRGNPLFPVSSLDEHISHLLPAAPAFYLHPRRNVLFVLLTMLGRMLNISFFLGYPFKTSSNNAFGVQVHLFTWQRCCQEDASKQEFDRHKPLLPQYNNQKLSDAGLKTREIMAVSGHKLQPLVYCGSNLQWPYNTNT